MCDSGDIEEGVEAVDIEERVEYDPQTETYRATCDWSVLDPSTTVLELVASIRDVDPLDLEPLYTYVDPDALDTLFQSEPANPTRSFTFEFAGDTVTVHGDGTVAVYRRDE